MARRRVGLSPVLGIVVTGQRARALGGAVAGLVVAGYALRRLRIVAGLGFALHQAAQEERTREMDSDRLWLSVDCPYCGWARTVRNRIDARRKYDRHRATDCTVR